MTDSYSNTPFLSIQKIVVLTRICNQEIFLLSFVVTVAAPITVTFCLCSYTKKMDYFYSVRKMKV